MAKLECHSIRTVVPYSDSCQELPPMQSRETLFSPLPLKMLRKVCNSLGPLPLGRNDYHYIAAYPSAVAGHIV